MKKIVCMFFMLIFCALTLNAQMIKEGRTFKIDTQEICKTRGYKSFTPLVVTIESNKIKDIDIKRNQEGPKYMKMVYDGLISKYIGMKINDVKIKQVDAVTGATYTSKAIIDNVNAAVNFFKENK